MWDAISSAPQSATGSMSDMGMFQQLATVPLRDTQQLFTKFVTGTNLN